MNTSIGNRIVSVTLQQTYKSMKKTLIALISMAGAAAAAVTDGYLTNPDALTWETLTLTTPANGVLSTGNSAIDWSEDTGALEKSWELSFVLDPSRLSNQYLFGTVKGSSGADGYTLSITQAGAISLNQNKSKSILTVGTYTAEDTAVNVTLTFVNYYDEVSNAEAGGEFTLTVGESSGSIEISQEVAAYTTFNKGSNNNIWTNGGAEKLSNITLKQGGYMIIPEPATATLSLLALAGLAARRRRK